MATRQRLDAEMVRRHLADTRSQAGQLIDDGSVLVSGAVAAKASRLVHPGEPIVLTQRPRFVSRGGDKLDGALADFAIDVGGRRVLDAGASTGGFTDCLLQRGAAHVVAVDVGHGQLHPRVRGDERVTVFERFHVKDLDAQAIGGAVDMVVADLSFISLTRVIVPIASTCRPGGTMVLLVKPQFEAGRQEVSRGRGVVTDPAVHARVRDEVGQALQAAGAEVLGWTTSPITGGDGNVEFFVHAAVSRP
jgi:23S rRNA (cytidine1920-2'-O)/16S rRNA (cytidine1409-2'-O)-methyltransferase